eukprot:m51a1_g11605 hypothetical protein (111) ;mRNA; r:154193-154644
MSSAHDAALGDRLVLENIFRHLADDPASLARVSQVCHRWREIASESFYMSVAQQRWDGQLTPEPYGTWRRLLADGNSKNMGARKRRCSCCPHSGPSGSSWASGKKSLFLS